MNLSQHFTLEEFTDSDTARRLGIDNSLPNVYLPVAEQTAQMMERIRHHLSYLNKGEVPVIITSGYRCLRLNAAIGSAPTSDHTRALAVDFRAPAFGSPLKICRALQPVMDQLGIGQMIYEHTWVHVSRRDPDKVINKVLTVNGSGYVAGIVEA